MQHLQIANDEMHRTGLLTPEVPGGRTKMMRGKCMGRRAEAAQLMREFHSPLTPVNHQKHKGATPQSQHREEQAQHRRERGAQGSSARQVPLSPSSVDSLGSVGSGSDASAGGLSNELASHAEKVRCP